MNTTHTMEPLEVMFLVAKKKDEEIETIGERLTRFRKERGITQVELAEKLRVSQPIISDYERGELRLHGELIVKIADILDVSADELLGIKITAPKSKPKGRMWHRLRKIEDLPESDRKTVFSVIDGLLAKQYRPRSSARG